MKSFIAIAALVAFLVHPLYPQFDVGKMLEKKVEKKAKDKTGKAIDKGLEEVEDAVAGDKKEKEATSETAGHESSTPELKAWSRYDFVPGEKVIFEDNLVREQNGEFPSRWDLLGGNAENASFGSDNVISFVASRTEITPLMKTKDYLPELFTVEFDIYFHQKGNEAYVFRFDSRNTIDIRSQAVRMGKFKGEPKTALKDAGWRRIAMSFNKRALKVYFNQDRVLNIPNLGVKPAKFSIEALSHDARKGRPAMIKNIRVCEGGVSLYDRVVADGKFVTRGIHFESGKAVVRPESFGVLKEIAAMMKDHPDLRFTVEGHTDSDGDEAYNKDLSERRAAAVRNALVQMGTDDGRFETAGWGESKPSDTNDTPEGKANNRRVEFIRM